MNESNEQLLKRFIKTGHYEGISFIILLAIAVPLKYYANMPEAVRLMGPIHGVLFILYCFQLLNVMKQLKWSYKKGAVAFLLSLVPFGTFWLYKLKG